MQASKPTNGRNSVWRVAIALALGALCCGATVAKDAATAAISATSTPKLPEPKVIPDVWVMNGSYKHLQGWHSLAKPVMTTESMAQLRAIACVADVATRRLDNQIALRGKDGKPVKTLAWVVDTAGITARGWRLSASAIKTNTYYLSTDLSRSLGLPLRAMDGQEVERIAYATQITSRGGIPVVPPEDTEVLIDTPAGQVRNLKVAYGGTFDADMKLLSFPPFDLVLRFEPLFRSKDENWTHDQLNRQANNNGWVVYARTKPGLAGAAREACRAQLDAHMQTWVQGLPRTQWELVPLKS